MNENVCFSVLATSQLRFVRESQIGGERCYYYRSMIKTLSKFSIFLLLWPCIFPYLLITLWSGTTITKQWKQKFIMIEASPDWNLPKTLPWKCSLNWHNSFSLHIYFPFFKIKIKFWMESFLFGKNIRDIFLSSSPWIFLSDRLVFLCFIWKTSSLKINMCVPADFILQLSWVGIEYREAKTCFLLLSFERLAINYFEIPYSQRCVNHVE